MQPYRVCMPCIPLSPSLPACSIIFFTSLHHLSPLLLHFNACLFFLAMIQTKVPLSSAFYLASRSQRLPLPLPLTHTHAYNIEPHLPSSTRQGIAADTTDLTPAYHQDQARSWVAIPVDLVAPSSDVAQTKKTACVQEAEHPTSLSFHWASCASLAQRQPRARTP
jgi:hypothetical protein